MALVNLQTNSETMFKANLIEAGQNGTHNAWIQFQTLYPPKSKELCFGFVEGVDDLIYYRHTTAFCQGRMYEIVMIQAGNKANLQQTYSKIIQQEKHDKERIVFFMDRDLSDLVDDPHIISDSNVYITDKYSIENEICSSAVLKRLIQDEMGGHSLHPDRINFFLNLFEKQKALFIEKMVPIMAHIVAWRRDTQRKPNFKNIKIKHILSFTKGEATFKLNDDQLLKWAYKQSNMDSIDLYNTEAENIKNEIAEKQLANKIIRGKYLKSFFSLFCISIQTDFNDELKMHGHEKLSENNIMNRAIPRSPIPPTLSSFFKKTLLKYHQKNTPAH